MKKIITYLISFLLLAAIGMMEACRKNDPPMAKPLAVNSFYPNSGNAGTLVTLLGSGFPADGKVMFGDRVAEVLNHNDTSMVVRAPENGQTGKLTLVTTDKTIEVGTYTYQQLSVRSFFPSNGPAGMHIRISGEGFGNTTSPAAVTINGVSATVVSVSDTLIVAEVPEDASSGPLTVVVDGKSSSGAMFRFQAIKAIKPLTGGPGTKVVINGSGFEAAPAGNLVDFNGKPAEVLEATESRLVVLAPADITTGPLSVTVSGQKIPGPAFTIVPSPIIEVVTPLSGPKGLEMSISGLNFSKEADENIVTINGTVVPVKTATATRLTLVLPGGTGDGKVVLAVNDQKVDGPHFKDQNLGIVQVMPATGLAGTKVTITGAGFSTVAAENIVTFNGIPATVESATETSLVVTTPAALTTGALVVRRAALEAHAPAEFLRAGVQTIYGGPGTGSFISFYATGIAVDSKGNIYVSSRGDGTIRKITQDGQVSVYAGIPNVMGTKNGTRAEATFGAINSIAIDAADNMYVSDQYTTPVIRKITPDGMVSTFIGSGLTYSGKLFLNKAGEVYITQMYQGMLKVYASGATEKLFNLTVSDVCQPAIDAAGNIYFMNDDYNSYLSRLAAGGGYTTDYLGSSDMGHVDGTRATARFQYGIGGLLMDKDNNMLILDRWNYAIRKYNLLSGEVSTMMKAGNGFADGSFDQAKFSSNTAGFAMDKEGSIYILDINNAAVRKVFLR
ncbi:IPT/TIG domain-containing protein [Chitinophaga jiangningensis]|uniref:IPT/TIG domain-containing protein n=1 Tax=Chitinophaga jiangningensis TaxID=1419482 RepID=A0A1M7J5J6_9BACT|nr:IPT/TIG domain-containing protein [Chitinophaga jiangningensis]SHM47697.1 IPT/TIG domain-containing protein [Chitinophaga jiangningensis]